MLVVIDRGLVKSRLQFEQTLGQFLFPNSHRKHYRVCCIGWSCGCIGFVHLLTSEYRRLNREEWYHHNYHIQWNRFRTTFPDKAHKLLDQKENPQNCCGGHSSLILRATLATVKSKGRRPSSGCCSCFLKTFESCYEIYKL